jgi:hypothetical protein
MSLQRPSAGYAARTVVPGLRLGLGAALVVAAMTATAAGASQHGLAANSAEYADERSEAAGAPDIGSVVVSNDDAGRIDFRIAVPSHPSLTQDMRIRLWFSDGHPATGLTHNGADGFILVDGFLLDFGTAALYRCQDSVCIPTAYSQEDSELGFSYASGARFTSFAEELGVRTELSTRLDFWVEVGAGYAYDPATQLFDLTNVRRDVAPSVEGESWTYAVRVGPGVPIARSLTTTPRFVRAGERVTVRLHVVGDDTGATIRSGTVSCAARVGSSRVRVPSGRFVGGRATCSFRVPSGATGKTLRGSISVALGGKTVRRTFTRRFR